MKLLLAALALAGVLSTATPDQPRPPRAAIVDLEKSFDSVIEKVTPSDPMQIMASTQGVYVPGFGAVFTAQVDLIVTPTLSPFRRTMSSADKQRILKRKVERLPVIRQQMRQLLTAAATSLKDLPPDEQVVLAVSIFHFGWEDTRGLPAQIVMQAERSEMLKRAAADNAIRIEEQ
jgi:hypothetical protein